MKRFHVHVAVDDLGRSIGFYSNLFGAAPLVIKDDYAKWMLDDPKVNFAISTRSRRAGVDHLGIQVETHEELGELAGRLKAAGEVTSRSGSDDLLLRAVGQGLGRRSFRLALGDVPYLRRSYNLRRGRAWSDVEAAGGLLRSGRRGLLLLRMAP